ncbi:MAG: ABC-type transport auxiliary lipoprotein family protein [Geminicoccaceae bacterium]
MSLPRRAFLTLPAIAAAAGCSPIDLVGGSRPPPRLYELTPKSTFPPDLPQVKGVVRVESATATAGLNTTRIALRPSPTALEYYANALWIDVLPVMVQNLFVESLENSGAIDAVGPAAAGVPARFGLLLHIREFQAEYSAPAVPPTARVRLQCRAVTLPRRDSVAATGAESAVEATGTALDAVVDAFDEALGKAMREIVVWAAQTLHAEETRR